MTICGPKCSLCCMLLSIWAVIQLTVMGGLYYTKSIALLEDLSLDEAYENPTKFYEAADEAYARNAYNCWIAAGLYLLTLLLSGQQLYMNNRTTVT